MLQQSDWHARVEEVERQVDVLASVLEELRSSVRGLRLMLSESAADAEAAPAIKAGRSVTDAWAAHGPDAASEGPTDEADETPAPQHETPAAETTSAWVAWSTEARPAESPSQPAPASAWETPSQEAETTPSEPSRGWDASKPIAASEPERQPSGFGWSVERPWPGNFGNAEPPQAEASFSAQELSGQDAEDEARREAVRRAVEEMRTGNFSEAAQTPPSAEDEDKARREAVRQQVERMRYGGLSDVLKEPSAYEAPAPEQPAAGEDDPAREEVRLAVERMNAEINGVAADELGYREPAEAAPEDKREDVRQLVDQIKAEMPTGRVDLLGKVAATDGAPDNLPHLAPAQRSWATQPLVNEPMGPPTIVIEDQSGRVDLARVYDTLARLECAGEAALLNYTPHSITVGLSSRVSPPKAESLSAAVQAVFGRDCEVVSEGTRMSVRIAAEKAA